MIVKYKNEEKEVKYGWREEMLFQDVTHGRIFKAESMTDCFYLFWSAMQCAFGVISFEEISSYLDTEEGTQTFANWMIWLAEYFSSFEKFKPKEKE